jgi:hypothetical protein
VSHQDFGLTEADEDGEDKSEEADDSIRPSGQPKQAEAPPPALHLVHAPPGGAPPAANGGPPLNPLVQAAQAAAAQVGGGPQPGAAAGAAISAAALAGAAGGPIAAVQAAAMRAAALMAAHKHGGGAAPPAAAAAAGAAAAAVAGAGHAGGFESEFEINDFVQSARWKVTHKGFQQEITELTGAAVTTKGIYVAPGALRARVARVCCRNCGVLCVVGWARSLACLTAGAVLPGP